MTEITFQVAQPQDLALLLQLAQRLGIPYAQKSSKDTRANSTKSSRNSLLTPALREKQLELMRHAARDPLFLADVQEVMNDFAHADMDEL